MAIDFTTGSHAAGYTLDKLAAYISMGRRSATVGTATIHGRCPAPTLPLGPRPHSIVVDDRTLTVVEGDDDGVSYTVKLSTQPSADVTVVDHGRRRGHGRDRVPGFADLHLIEPGTRRRR